MKRPSRALRVWCQHERCKTTRTHTLYGQQATCPVCRTVRIIDIRLLMLAMALNSIRGAR